MNERLYVPPPAARRRAWTRPLAVGIALALTALLSGDRGGRAAATVQGIDPLEILELQVKPNVLFVVDTSQAMGFNPEGTLYLGGDDPHSRLYQTKQALREVLSGNDGKANFGIIGLNANQAELDLQGRLPGAASFALTPMVYVSDPRTPFGATWAGRFDDLDSLSIGDYDGLPYCNNLPTDLMECSNEIHDSFFTDDQFAAPYQGRHYILSLLLRNNVRFTWDTSGAGNFDRSMTAVDTNITCPAPPPGLLGDDTDEFNDGTETRACFEIVNSNAPTEITRYYLTSATFGPDTGAGVSPECDPATPDRCLVMGVPACTAGTNVPAMLAGALRTQLPLDPATGLPTGVPVVQVTAAATDDLVGLQPNVAGGLQLGRRRPLDNALRAALTQYTGTIFPNRPAAVDGLQRNFVIVIASGGDNFTGLGAPAVTAATMRGAGNPPGANEITTLVVTLNGEATFPTSLDKTALDSLMSAGTLGRLTRAFAAANGTQLKQALNAAMAETIAAGEFSTESSITESIFEYAAQANTITPARSFDPLNPASRYGARIPTLLQSSFEMPGFVGHLRAYQSPGVSGCPAGSILRTDPNGRPTCEVWDAGVKLRERVWRNSPANNGMCPAAAPGDYTACSAVTSTFEQLRGSGPQPGTLSAAHPTFRPDSSARIQRRIFTTARRGVFAYQTLLGEPFGPAESPSDAQCPVPLWPPTSTATVGSCTGVGPVAPPPGDDSAGILDDELGIATMSFAELQSRFGACAGAGAPLVCSGPDPARLDRARREARETILAFLAGAEQVQSAGLPTRQLVSGVMLYRARQWPLSESTLGVPAVVPPPLEAPPVTHTAEYALYRDGVRTSAGEAPGGSYNPVKSGFGLRNPDKNAGAGIGAPTLNNGFYEPLMTVVYHVSNDMVHAFRAGPCAPSSCTESGGEELWGFVPNDQLDKLQDRMRGQGRSPHTYMIASPVRFNDLFVPGEWVESVTGRTYLGRWRTAMVFGRGIAGKSYTALDITAPGQFTRASLDTLPPFAIWSRGNPDTQDGTPSGPPNTATDPTGDDGAADAAAYLRMGETWSVPAMAAVNPDEFFDKQFVMFMGSGYSTGDPNEGKTFYAVDALTGDVLYDAQVPDSTKTCNVLDPGETCPVPNALVANAAAYIPSQLVARFVGNPAASTASLVYIGDLHGRMWKFIAKSGDLGLLKLQPDTDPAFVDSPDQPIGTAVALLNIDGFPHVYWETGNDLRVIPPDPFKFVAVKDLGGENDPSLAGAGLFVERLEGSLLGFRGTAQPATAFNATGLGRVFFIGTKFTDANVANGDCQSRFDSVLFAVGAVSGSAVYDLDNSGTIAAGEKSFMVSGKVNAIRGSLGQIVLDKGEVNPTTAPPAPPPPKEADPTNVGSSGEVFMTKIKPNSSVCR